MREIQSRKSVKPDVEGGLGEILAAVVVVLAAHHAVDGGEVAGVIHRRSERGTAVLPGGRRRGRQRAGTPGRAWEEGGGSCAIGRCLEPGGPDREYKGDTAGSWRAQKASRRHWCM